MMIQKLLFVLCAFSWAISENVYPVGDIRNCPVTQPTNSSAPLLRMEVLPGLGFDNLRNIDMGLVIQRNYSLCKVTNDGRFLIPDDAVVVPLQKTSLDTFATFFAHWDNYTSMDSFSINVGASVYSLISGKFGFEYQHVKQHQYNDDAKTTRVQIRNSLYKIILQPDSAFNVKFKNRLLDIAANIQSNNTYYATYLSDLLIRDFGTHVVRTVEAGAIAAQIDSISSNYVSEFESSLSSITASASANFFGKFSFSVSSSFSNGQTDDTGYVKSRNHSHVLTMGGPPFRPNMSLQEWEEGILDNLVAIDRSGDPLHYFITPDTLPELPAPTLRELIDSIYYSIQRYYGVNTHYGCTDPGKPNFDYQANLDDGTCTAPSNNYTFGGVFQTCQVDPDLNYQNLCTKEAAQVNPLTGDYSCPSGYTAVELHSGTVTGISKKEVCDRICHHCGLFGWSRCCQCMSAWVNVLSAANYQAYWCVAEGEVEANKGYMFGGVYTPKAINPVTQSMSCPNHFYPLHIGNDMEVCVSTEYELGYAYSIPFAGFYSCNVGNALAAGKLKTNNVTSKSSTPPKRCPKTYTKVLATVDEGCEINYCVKLRSQYSTGVPTLPPYRSQPDLKKNLTQSLVIQGPYGEIWIKDENGDWVEEGPQLTGKELLQYFSADSTQAGVTTISPNNGDNDNPSTASTVASVLITAVVTFFVCTLLIIGVFGSYKLWKRRKQGRGNLSLMNNNYTQIEDNDNNEGRVAPSSRTSSFIANYSGINADPDDRNLMSRPVDNV